MATCSFSSSFSSMSSSGSAATVRYVLAGVGVGLVSSAIKRAAKSSEYWVSLRERFTAFEALGDQPIVGLSMGAADFVAA